MHNIRFCSRHNYLSDSIPKGEYFQDYSEEWKKSHPNIPFDFLRNKKDNMDPSCVSTLEQKDNINNDKNTKNVLGIMINIEYWQKVETAFGIIYLYNAYYDNRRKSDQTSKVRIIAMSDRSLIDNVKLDCLMWYNETVDHLASVLNKRVQIKRMSPYIGKQTWKKSNTSENYTPYLLTCDVPTHKSEHIPGAVSIIETGFQKRTCYKPSNYLKVIYNTGEKKDFAVCVRGLFYLNDISIQLIEWIELLSLMGTNKIFLYDLHMHSDTEKVLNYYVTKGIVDLTKTYLSGNQPNEPILQNKYFKDYNLRIHNQVVLLNDCFYRNVHRYKYIAIFDVDEIIIPRKLGQTWIDLIPHFEENKAFHYVKTAYFFSNASASGNQTDRNKTDNLGSTTENVPTYMHMLGPIHRSKRYTELIKSFLKTENVELVTSHMPSSCLENKWNTIWEYGQWIKPDVALAHHYRSGCKKSKDCNSIYENKREKDTTIWEFKNKLISNTKEMIYALNLTI